MFFMQVCLSTQDKMEFYRKCGYAICEPILNCGANSNLFEKFDAKKIFAKKQNFETIKVCDLSTKLRNNSSVPSFPQQIPKFNSQILNKTYMFKLIDVKI